MYSILFAGLFALQLQAAEKPAVADAGADRPNVVFILIDDLSHYGITAYGADRISSEQGFFTNVTFRTPRIDSLAADGLRCDYAYVYPLCEPSRVALMSGMNNNRNFIEPKALFESQITFGDVFKRAGYATCIAGKWKQSRGTREFPGKEYIYRFGWDEFYCFDVIGEGRRMIEPWLVLNGTSKTYTGVDPETGRRWFGPDICNRYALDFIDRHKDEPFFLYYPLLLVHDEHTPTPDTVPRSAYDDFDIDLKTEYGHLKGDDRRYFPDMLAYMDKMVGRILDKLAEHGLREKTLVVVMGDNGTKECFSHVLPDGTVFPGGKGDSKENGTHVPLLLSRPGTIPANGVYKGLIDVTDIYPTLCDAAGIQLPNGDTIDGVSFWKQAIGERGTEHRRSFYVWYNANHSCTNTPGVQRYAQTRDFKRYAPDADFPAGRFFDLRTDPFEEAGGNPKEWKYLWRKWHYQGLDIDQLTPEQRAAYDELGEVLAANRYVPVERLQAIKSEIPLRAGQSRELRAKVFPADATRQNVIWMSSDPSIASVDKFGMLTAHREGAVDISVYTWDDAYPVANDKEQSFLKTGIQDRITVAVER
jgi:arylsulfatase A-like enzyme